MYQTNDQLCPIHKIEHKSSKKKKISEWELHKSNMVGLECVSDLVDITKFINQP